MIIYFVLHWVKSVSRVTFKSYRIKSFESFPAKVQEQHFVKRVRSWSFSGTYFPAFGLNTEIYIVNLCIYQMRENTEHENSKYGLISRDVVIVNWLENTRRTCSF